MSYILREKLPRKNEPKESQHEGMLHLPPVLLDYGLQRQHDHTNESAFRSTKGEFTQRRDWIAQTTQRY
jgi:hypothetical protein